MSGTDIVRLTWAVGMGVSAVVTVSLLVTLLVDVYAISTNPRTNGLVMFQRYTEGEVWIVTLVLSALVAFFLAAMASYRQLAELTLLLLLIGGIVVMVIPLYLHIRRKRIMAAVRIRPRKEA